jgi:hypothetical protein
MRQRVAMVVASEPCLLLPTHPTEEEPHCFDDQHRPMDSGRQGHPREDILEWAGMALTAREGFKGETRACRSRRAAPRAVRVLVPVDDDDWIAPNLGIQLRWDLDPKALRLLVAAGHDRGATAASSASFLRAARGVPSLPEPRLFRQTGRPSRRGAVNALGVSPPACGRPRSERRRVSSPRRCVEAPGIRPPRPARRR